MKEFSGSLNFALSDRMMLLKWAHEKMFDIIMICKSSTVYDKMTNNSVY